MAWVAIVDAVGEYGSELAVERFDVTESACIYAWWARA